MQLFIRPGSFFSYLNLDLAGHSYPNSSRDELNSGEKALLVVTWTSVADSSASLARRFMLWAIKTVSTWVALVENWTWPRKRLEKIICLALSEPCTMLRAEFAIQDCFGTETLPEGFM